VACEQDRLVEYDLVSCIVDQDRRSRLEAAARERELPGIKRGKPATRDEAPFICVNVMRRMR
jgi:hypothetical protein